MKNVKQAMQDRFTTVKYDPTFQLSDDQINEIIEAAQSAPSSIGLQHATVLVLKNQAIKDELSEFFMANNTAKVKDASAVFIIKGLSKEFFMQNNYEEVRERKVKYLTSDPEQQEIILNALKGAIDMTGYNSDVVTSSIVTSFIALQASAMDLDSTIMGGINTKELTEELRKKGLATEFETVQLAIAIGKADMTFEKNQLSKANRTRIAKDKFVKVI